MNEKSVRSHSPSKQSSIEVQVAVFASPTLGYIYPMSAKCRSLLMLHGNGGGGFRFSRCLPHFSGELEVVTPTLPGFHPEPRNPRLKTLKDYAEKLLPWVSSLERPRCLLGTGIGGSLILEFLQHYPQEADRVILHAPVGAFLDRRRFPKLLRLPGVAYTAKNMVGHPAFRYFWKRLFFETTLPPAFIREFFQGYLYCQSFGQMFQLINQEWFDSLTPMSTPGAILWGARERLLSIDQKDPFLNLLANTEMKTLKHWRHFPMVEQPEEFAEQVEALL